MAPPMERQKAVDLSHHLSDLSRARAVSPLKGLARYFERPDIISLAGGTYTESDLLFPLVRSYEWKTDAN